MPPIKSDITLLSDEDKLNLYDCLTLRSIIKTNEIKVKNESRKEETSYFMTELKWFNIIFFALFHIAVIYSLLTFPFLEKKFTAIYSVWVATMGALGTICGTHRLWTHRAYKAKWPLRVIVLYWFYSSGQNSVYDWVRDHRIHHKYSETVADPHDSTRGFFFAHIGWLMMKKHPELIRRGREVDMSDILSDPVVAFGDKYFLPLKILCSFVIPTIVPVYLWNEEWHYAITSQIWRYALFLHGIWSINSFAHMWGTRPYDQKIAPRQNVFIAVLTMGEGWHNYHHVFPWDYRASEFGNHEWNPATAIIDMFAKIGWAYDMKQPSKDLVKAVIKKRGNGSHPIEEPEPDWNLSFIQGK